MIEITNVITPSPEQWMFVIRGMRNPMNSWAKSDSKLRTMDNKAPEFKMGKDDLKLMTSLAKSGPDHRKFLRQLPVSLRINAPLYFWRDFDAYKVGTVANSCSTMHKIHEKVFAMSDFSKEYFTRRDILNEIIDILNELRKNYLETKDKHYWYNMIQLLPNCYNQARNITLNYEVLANMYWARKEHKLDEWVEFCAWIMELPYSEIIVSMKFNKEVLK